MIEDHDLRRRVGQFCGYLEAMYRRSREVREFCFIIFEDAFTDEAGIVQRSASIARPRVLTATGPGIFTTDETGSFDTETEDESPRRHYVQIGFVENYFFMDMPVESTLPEEADEIVATRHGFRRASANPITSMDAKDIKDFDPLQKFYLYGEEREAAEDVAHIFFEVFGLPADARLYVSSHSSSGAMWERGESLE